MDEVEKRLGVDVVVVDHHANAVRAQRFYNPVARGAAEDDYPSTTWVLRELMPRDTAIVVVSDHGTKAMKGAFVINQWLEEKGYLKLKEKPKRQG